MKKKFYCLVFSLILIAGCSTDYKKTNLLKLSNADKISFLKSLTSSELDDYINSQSQHTRQKAGTDIIKEGRAFIESENYQSAYDYLYFANQLTELNAEYNYLMAKVCAKLKKVKQALYHLTKANRIDKSYAKRSAEDNDFLSIRDTKEWRALVYSLNVAELAGRWKGNRGGSLLILNSNKTWNIYDINTEGEAQEKKTGNWKLNNVILADGKKQSRISFSGEISATYVVQVEPIEGYVMYELNRWLAGNRLISDWKKRLTTEAINN